jgi:TatD DNase family protein
MMIETDCPFLAPQKYRGKTNEPSYVVEVAKKIAELKNISIAEVGNQTDNNAITFFGLSI